jgi:hypothetical protein
LFIYFKDFVVTRGLVEQVASIARDMRKLTVQNTPTQTPAALAKNFIGLLGENDKQVQMPADMSQDAVLTEEQSSDLIDLDMEWSCVRFMTPHFTALFGDEVVVVNSEEFGWLETGAGKQKPDLFVTHKWVYDRRKLTDVVYARRHSAGFRFGGICDTRLYDSVFILDCKKNCTNEAIGELIIHLQHVSYHLPSHSVVRGMLFSCSAFMLLKMQGLELIERVTGKWTTPGSKAYISEFFRPLPWVGVEQICSKLNVEVDESPEVNMPAPAAFLGAGTFGRVIRVRQVVEGGGNLFALKVSLSKNASELEIELGRLQLHANTCGCNILVRPESLHVLRTTYGLCGYMMSPVGKPLGRREDLTNENLESAVQALYGLHTHNPPIVHGDARLSNLIVLLDGGLTWVDLSHSQWGLPDIKFGLKKDISTFMGSVFGNDYYREDMAHFKELESCATTCSESTTVENYDALYVKLRLVLIVQRSLV